MRVSGPRVEQITGASTAMQHLYFRRGLLRFEAGTKRCTGNERIYDLVGLFGLRLINALRNGDPTKGIPPVSYQVITELVGVINAMSESDLHVAAARKMWLVFGPPLVAAQLMDMRTADIDHIPARFWFGWDIHDAYQKLLAKIEATRKEEVLA